MLQSEDGWPLNQFGDRWSEDEYGDPLPPWNPEVQDPNDRRIVWDFSHGGKYGPRSPAREQAHDKWDCPDYFDDGYSTDDTENSCDHVQRRMAYAKTFPSRYPGTSIKHGKYWPQNVELDAFAVTKIPSLGGRMIIRRNTDGSIPKETTPYRKPIYDEWGKRVEGQS